MREKLRVRLWTGKRVKRALGSRSVMGAHLPYPNFPPCTASLFRVLFGMGHVCTSWLEELTVPVTLHLVRKSLLPTGKPKGTESLKEAMAGQAERAACCSYEGRRYENRSLTSSGQPAATPRSRFWSRQRLSQSLCCLFLIPNPKTEGSPESAQGHHPHSQRCVFSRMVPEAAILPRSSQ